MYSFKLILSYLIFFLIPFVCFSQTLKFEQYTTKDGLPSDEIYNLHQDSKGYIWVFTNYGALKYNGKEFKPVLKNLPFNESFFYSIFENKKGQKWVANSNSKIYEVRNDSAFILKGIEEVSENLRKQVNEVYQLYVDDSSSVFVLTKGYSYKLIKKDDQTFLPISLNEKNERDSMHYVVMEKENELMSILKFTHKEYQNPPKFGGGFNIRLHQKTNPLNFNLLGESFVKPKFFKRYGKDIYFSAYNKLGKITGTKISYIPFNSHIQNFVKDKRNHLWVACYANGLFELDEKDSVLNHYFKDLTVNDILIDAENGLWVSSIGGGLYHCKNLNSLHFNEQEPLGTNIVFTKVLNGVLYIANSKGDVYSADQNSFKYINKSDSKNIPLDIIKVDDNLLIAYWHKIEKFKILTPSGRIIRSDAINAENPLKIISMGAEKLLYGTRNAFGFNVNGKLVNFFKVDQKIYTFEIRDGLLFIATDKGVYQLTKKTLNEFFNSSLTSSSLQRTKLEQPAYLSGTKNTIITKITKDNRGNLWFCSTGNGLFKLTLKNELSHFSVANGLPSDIINNMSFNEGSCILLSTNKGLYVATENRSETLPSNWARIYPEEVKNALLFEKKIYAGTTNGLVILDYTKTNASRKIFFNLNSVYINSREANTDALKQLSYDQNDLEFNFDLISFSDTKYTITYKLTGAVKESGIAKNSTVKFQNLPAGSYTLSTFPQSDKNLRIDLEFKIVPAFWQTKIFYVLVSIVLLIFVFYFFRLIILNNQKKEIEKLYSERLISEYKLAAIKAQMDPHFIFNSLNTIQQFIIVNDNEKAQLYLSTFSQLIRMLLESNTGESISLKQEIEILEKYLEIESLRFNNAFDYEIIVKENIDISVVRIPYFLIQPFVENAIHHGLLPKLGYKELTITFEKPNPITIRCIIDDNGVGRKNSSPKKMPFKTKSLGVNFVKQHLAIMSKIEKHNYNVGIWDKQDKSGANQGTQVIITMPILNK